MDGELDVITPSVSLDIPQRSPISKVAQHLKSRREHTNRSLHGTVQSKWPRNCVVGVSPRE